MWTTTEYRAQEECEEECGRQSETEEEEGRLDDCFPPGLTILTICERLEAHLAAVFAKTSHGPSSHLHHIDGTRPQALHTRRVCLASQDSGVDLSMVLE